MFLRCNKTQEPAVDVWEQRQPHHEVSQENTKGQPGEHRLPVRSAREAQTRNNSMNGSEVRSTREAHIDIYQGPGGTVELAPEGEREVILLAESLENQDAKNNVGLSAKPKNPSKRRKP
jgi:hypothetical protein